MANEKKSKGNFSKFIVGFVIAINIIFTIAVLKIFKETSAEPTALIGAFFAFTTVELWQLATIKKSKVQSENRKGEEYDN